MLPSVVEYLYDELDGVSDLMRHKQSLMMIRVRGTAIMHTMYNYDVNDDCIVR